MPGPSEFSASQEQAMRNRNQIPRAGESADSLEIRTPLPNDRNTMMPDDVMRSRLATVQQSDA